MEEDLDLTEKEFSLDREIYLSVIKGSLLENYPNIDLNNSLNEFKMKESDLLDKLKYQSFVSSLSNRIKNNGKKN